MRLSRAATGRHRADVVLLAELSAGRTVAEAAGTAGVSERSAYRRLGDAAFRETLATAQRAALAEASRTLAANATLAARTLGELLGEANPPAVRLAAARATLDLAARWRELDDLEARVEALEAGQHAERVA